MKMIYVISRDWCNSSSEYNNFVFTVPLSSASTSREVFTILTHKHIQHHCSNNYCLCSQKSCQKVVTPAASPLVPSRVQGWLTACPGRWLTGTETTDPLATGGERRPCFPKGMWTQQEGTNTHKNFKNYRTIREMPHHLRLFITAANRSVNLQSPLKGTSISWKNNHWYS